MGYQETWKPTLYVLWAFYWLEPLSPAPNSVINVAHTHPAPNFELQRIFTICGL